MKANTTSNTTFVHAGRKKRMTQGSVNPVIQRASSLVFDCLADKKKQAKISPKAHYITAAAAHSLTLLCKI
ncbi:hypothetical protein [Avibacterium endocarditidis]|uniref:hypothetical protein n=1 Tax=Avibacterium endocarditidis TaxID=380674 RepID=UPI001FEC1563|nr:hypothetical protein [Avibacterium endocarditidis]